ncbi:BnaA03g47690D [Brassica napus]|uniref:BnaA03g47690D protein n=1 Tax=Brassica napus TaxID=3708 RepID=A0A078HWB0_BRANA|nr:BnaA03g47690D [Brassica napus]
MEPSDDLATEVEKEKKAATPKVSFLKLFSFADFNDCVLMTLGSIGACIHGASVPVFFIFFGKLINIIGIAYMDRHQASHKVAKYSLDFVYLSVAILFSSWLEVACWMHTGERQAAKMRRAYLRSILSQDISLFDTEASSGEVISAITSDILVVQDALSEKVGNFLHYISRFIAGFAIGFTSVWQISLVTLAIVPLIALAGGMYAFVAIGLIARVRKSYIKAGQVAEEVIGNVRTVQAFTGEERAAKLYRGALKSTYKYGRKAGLIKGLGLGSLHCILFLSWALLVWFTSVVVHKGIANAGESFTTMLNVVIAGLSLGQAAPDISAFVRAKASAHPIFQMIERDTAAKTSAKSGRKLSKVDGHIQFTDVTFSYPSRPDVVIFDKLNLAIPAGKTVALVGGSGSGKSTVISLIERFYEPTSGAVLLDGNDIKELDIKWLRGHIGLVSQEPALFATTIRENIIYGKDGATDEEIGRAAKLSDAFSFINNLPEGFETQNLVSNPDGAYSALLRLQEAASLECNPSLDRTLSRPHSTQYSREQSRTSSCLEKESVTREDGEDQSKEAKVTMRRRLYSMIRPDWLYGICGTLCAFIAGSLMPLFALGVSHSLVSYYEKGWDNTQKEVKKIAILFCFASAITLIVYSIEHLCFGIMGERLTRRVREKMFLAILKNEMGWFDEVDNTSSMLASTILLQNLGLVVTSFVISFMLNWRLTLVVLATYPLVISGHISEKLFMQGYGGNLSKAYLKANMLAGESVSNIRTVAAFCAEEKVLELYSKELLEPSKRSFRRGQTAGLFYGISQFFIFSSYGLALWYGSTLMDNKISSFKSLMKTFMVLIVTALAMGETLALAPDLLKGNQMIASVFEILDRKSQLVGETSEELTNVEGTIELKGIQFSYPSRPNVVIFKDFDLIVRSGQSMALVGQSGSGKSSVISLILRFYDPTAGTIMIEGKDIKKLDLKALRKHIGLVQQEPALFATTIYENILYGNEEASHSEVIESAMFANAHSFITSLPEGYNTKVGERGVQMSGGQRQRIAIARAILRNPEILLLDEATSALDTESERVVQQALDRLMTNRTTVVIAHRLSTIKNADTISVLHGGKIVQQGSHRWLVLNKVGPYFNLFNLQQQPAATTSLNTI